MTAQPNDAWAPDELDELGERIRALEAERLRPVPKAFTSRAHADAYNVLTRGYEAELAASESAEIEQRRAALLEDLGDDADEED